MSLILTAPQLELHPTPLTQSSFAAFGSVISSPLPSSTQIIPHPPPPPASAVTANQHTALKYPNISPISSTYRLSPSGTPASPRMTFFSCFPRQTCRLSTETASRKPATAMFDVPVLERHPYTTQTFIPIQSQLRSEGRRRARYIVVVAPTVPQTPALPGLTPYFPQAQPAPGLPDLTQTKAFIAEEGMGVTYGVGIWHAPMIVIGDERIDFVVTQYMSGRDHEDCQEVALQAKDRSRGIELIVGPEQSGSHKGITSNL